MTLADVIARCKKSDAISPYLIHYTITKNGTVPGTPVGLVIISAAFARARGKAGVPDENAPSFREIRSLSKRLHDKQRNVGMKALLGHMSIHRPKPTRMHEESSLLGCRRVLNEL
ncbi:hypothetical protein [Burkholderia sp. LMG 32019]|uniref:hypothetical protein n=1 Tax=Burkholderia sp. LMG 32019 TaxID=3158173 RepID=UPI003C2E6A53